VGPRDDPKSLLWGEEGAVLKKISTVPANLDKCVLVMLCTFQKFITLQ